jgi:Mn-dependent DtxR family transcriptional regulator
MEELGLEWERTPSERVLTALREMQARNGRPVRLAEIIAECQDINTTTVSSAMNGLVADGLARRIARGVYYARPEGK